MTSRHNTMNTSPAGPSGIILTGFHNNWWEKLQQEVEKMLQLGVIEPSCSEWCIPVVIIFKKDELLWICIEDLLEKIGTARYIATLDLCKGYWIVQMK